VPDTDELRAGLWRFLTYDLPDYGLDA